MSNEKFQAVYNELKRLKQNRAIQLQRTTGTRAKFDACIDNFTKSIREYDGTTIVDPRQRDTTLSTMSLHFNGARQCVKENDVAQFNQAITTIKSLAEAALMSIPEVK